MLEVELKAIKGNRNMYQSRIQTLTSRSDDLRRTNVLDDAFFIYHDGHFGTINGFRLGRLTSQQVPWNEINAALGDCILLIDTVAKAVGYEFKKCNLLPRGSFSRIQIKADSTVLDFFKQSRGIFNRSFDLALSCFLGCVQEIGDYASMVDGSPIYPYAIKGDTCGGLSIRIQLNQDENWTKCLKYLLLDLKSLLYWCARNDQ